jgi:hypothetical protein
LIRSRVAIRPIATAYGWIFALGHVMALPHPQQFAPFRGVGGR